MEKEKSSSDTNSFFSFKRQSIAGVISCGVGVLVFLGWRSHISPILLILVCTFLPKPARGEQPSIASEDPPKPLECVVNTHSNPVEQGISRVPQEQEMTGETLEKLAVTQFEFIGNTAFSEESLNEKLAQFTEREITFTELIEAVSIVTQTYNQEGYINSYAVPYEQKITDGVVKIAIIEGGLGTITLIREGKRRLHSNYICRRLAIAATPLNTNSLLAALRLLQLNPLIKNLSAELVAGVSPESNNLNIYFEENPTLSIEFGTDNGRAPSVGTFRRQVQLRHDNLLGLGDRLSVGYSNTDGSDTFSADYTLPINAYNGTLTFAYGNATNRVIEPPFDAINLRGDSRYFDISLRQPIWQKPSREFALGLTASRLESDTSILGSSFPLAPGASRRGKTRLSVLRFTQEGLWRGDNQILGLRSQFSLGLGLFDATTRSEPPDGRFFLWRGQAQWIRRFGDDQLLFLGGNVQLASQALVPLEQFGLGGLGSVRGYRQDARLADNGAFASVEFRYPLLGNSQGKWGVLQVAPFLDIGTVWNNDNRANLQPQTLASGGLGLRWQMGNHTSASFYWGIPFVEVESSNRTWQENGLYFQVQTRFFF